MTLWEVFLATIFFATVIIVPAGTVFIICYIIYDVVRSLRKGHTCPPMVPRRISLKLRKPQPLFQSDHRKINKDIGP